MPHESTEVIEQSIAAALPPVFQSVMKLTRLGGQLSRPFFQTYAHDYSLTLNEWRVIVLLHARPGIAAQDVSHYTGIHPMNVSRAVNALREAGRLTSEPDAENHRRQMLTLTAQGTELFEALYPSAEQQANALFSVLSDEEQAVFGEFLDRLLAQSEVILGDDDSRSGQPVVPSVQ
jgi:DNA-binding MarR family transcriptional regulator